MTVPEVLEEYHQLMDHLIAKASGRYQCSLDEEVLRKEVPKLMDPLAYYVRYVHKEGEKTFFDY